MNHERTTHLDLFTGIYGFGLAAERCNAVAVPCVEWIIRRIAAQENFSIVNSVDTEDKKCENHG